jgi:hypothetical protein
MLRRDMKEYNVTNMQSEHIEKKGDPNWIT